MMVTVGGPRTTMKPLAEYVDGRGGVWQVKRAGLVEEKIYNINFNLLLNTA